MGRKWFTIAVGILWLTSMSWLVQTKLLPQMLAGPPPSNATVYSNTLDPDATVVPIAWELFWGKKSLGWAVSTSRTNVEGFTEIKSHAHFEHLPFEEFLPVFLRAFVSNSGGKINDLSFEAESRLLIDGDGRLNRMTFVVGNSVTDEPVRVDGRVEADKLYISIYNQGRQRTSAWELSANAIVGNDLTPMVRMPNLYIGRTWNVPVYSMFQIGSTAAVEVMRAEVEGETTLTWEGAPHRCWLVVMRRDSGSLLGGARTPRGKMWVEISSGTILQQETIHGHSKLVYTRASDERAKEYHERAVHYRTKRTQDLLQLPADEIPSELDDHDAPPGRKLPHEAERPDPNAETESIWSRAAKSFFRDHSATNGEPQEPRGDQGFYLESNEGRRMRHFGRRGPRHERQSERDPWAEFDVPGAGKPEVATPNTAMPDAAKSVENDE
ncbi:MAG: hypothetical protein QM811_20555 [Pirellulales bacterium]